MLLGGLRRSCFGIAFTLLMSVVVILCSLIDPPRGKPRGLAWKALKWWTRGLLAGSNVQVRVFGIEHLPSGDPTVLVANHASHFDVPAIWWATPVMPQMVAKRELERLPFFGRGMRRLGTIIIDRGDHAQAMASLQRAADRIRDGVPVLLFAEGRRSRDGELQDFKKGAFILACQSGAAVTPVVVQGTNSVLPAHTWLVHGGPVEVHFLPPVRPPQIYDQLDEHARKACVDALRATVHAQMADYLRGLTARRRAGSAAESRSLNA